jgi:RHS repeat-associated protein
VRHFVWGPDIAGQQSASLESGAEGVGGLLLIREWKSGRGMKQYLPLTDGLGSVCGLIDASDGSLAAEYDYDPYGGPVIERGIAADACPFRHRTRYYDSESWLYYYGYRYYDPSTTKWISKDPLGEKGGWNLTCFCSNDPVNRFDPTGFRDLLEYMTEIQLTRHPNERLSTEEGNLLISLYERYETTNNRIWMEYQTRTSTGLFLSHLLNFHNNVATYNEALLLRSLQKGQYLDRLSKKEQALFILDTGTREMVFTSLAKLTVQATAMVASKAVNQVTLAHLTNEAGSQGIDATGKIIGKHGFFAVPEGVSAEATGLKCLRTGLSPAKTMFSVKVPGAATPLFTQPLPLGPYSAWKFLGGVRYASPGVIDTATGAFTPTFSLIRPELFIYGPDVLFWTAIGVYPSLSSEEFWLDDEYKYLLETNKREPDKE